MHSLMKENENALLNTEYNGDTEHQHLTPRGRWQNPVITGKRPAKACYSQNLDASWQVSASA